MSLTEQIKNIAFVGMVLQNPGGGTSIIRKVDEKKIAYIRGKSIISIPYNDIETVYNKFKNQICTSSDLKLLNPQVFDSKKSGHSCNCTFLFLIMEQLELINGRIQGKGVRGNPFFVEFK